LKRLLPIALAVGAMLLAATANGELVKFGNLVLTADGGFTPRTLPRRAFAPIEFKGRADLRAVDGGIPVPVRRIVLEFDRDGRLDTAGLPTCNPSLLASTAPEAARAACANSIVGTGHVGALIAAENGSRLEASSPLTIFNGPRDGGGHPTAILHTRLATPAPQTLVLTVPIEKRGGEYRYRATIDVPAIAGGRGSLVHVDATVGRRYRFRGSPRSYVSARCSDGVLQTHGRFEFADGSLVDGSVQRGCTVR
jgi:hypothetical protein